MSVDVHCFTLEAEPSRVEELATLLAPKELERASRFRFERDRNRYVVCRGTLREFLGEEMQVDPASLRFVYGLYGKPMLESSHVQFNVSHSYDMAMIAIARGREVGCDIERIDPSFANEHIPEGFFSPYEVRALRSLPVDQQCDAFFRCWTRKEAYIKACGMGVSLALNSFDVTLAPNQPAALLRGADGWSVQNFDAPPGYAAAVVARGNDWSINVQSPSRLVHSSRR